MLLIAGTDEAREFAIRCYRWALEQWRFEAENGLPMLRSMGDLLPAKTLKDLPPDRIQAIGKALSRRSKGAAFLGEKMSKEEQRLIDSLSSQYLSAAWQWATREKKFKLSPAGRRQLGGLVRQALQPVLGVPERSSVSTWIYGTQIRHWQVFTEVQLHSGGEWHLTYEHTVVGAQPVARMLSLLPCMTLYSQTLWVLESEESFSAAAQGIAMACDRFLHGEPRILI